MKRLSALGLVLLLATPALAQSIGEKTGVNSAVGVTPSTQDFVTEAAQSDMFEIQSSNLALAASDAPTKTFAQQMITDHGKTTAELKTAVQSGSVQATLPTTMSSSQQSMLDKLRGLHGIDFMSQYDSDQVSVHKDAVSLFQRYRKGADNTTLKVWAGLDPADIAAPLGHGRKPEQVKLERFRDLPATAIIAAAAGGFTYR